MRPHVLSVLVDRVRQRGLDLMVEVLRLFIRGDRGSFAVVAAAAVALVLIRTAACPLVSLVEDRARQRPGVTGSFLRHFIIPRLPLHRRR